MFPFKFHFKFHSLSIILLLLGEGFDFYFGENIVLSYLFTLPDNWRHSSSSIKFQVRLSKSSATSDSLSSADALSLAK